MKIEQTTLNKTEKLAESIHRALEGHDRRKAAGIEEEKILSELIFAIECLLDCEVSEGRKS